MHGVPFWLWLVFVDGTGLADPSRSAGHRTPMSSGSARPWPGELPCGSNSASVVGGLVYAVVGVDETGRTTAWLLGRAEEADETGCSCS